MEAFCSALYNKCLPLWEKYNTHSKFSKPGIWEFDEPIRTNWYNQIEIRGVKLSNLSDSMVEKCFDILSLIFIDTGMEKIQMMVKHTPLERFSFCFYGKPDFQNPWGFSMEGPNLSLNFTVKGNQFSFTPMMFGTDSSIVKVRGDETSDIMLHEEGIATDLMSMFDKTLLSKILINSNAPNDLQYCFDEEFIYPKYGLPITEISDSNQLFFIKMLLSVYLGAKLQKAIVDDFASRYEASLSDVKFIWMGETVRNSKHYYAFASPSFTIEYLNKEANKNNVSTVFREKDNDFGYLFMG